MKKLNKAVFALLLATTVVSAQAGGDHNYHNPHHNQGKITGSISAFSNGGAWAGGNGQNLQTLTQSASLVNGSMYSQNLGHKNGWDVNVGFGNLAQARNGGAGPSSTWTGANGNAGFTVIPPSMPHR